MVLLLISEDLPHYLILVTVRDILQPLLAKAGQFLHSLAIRCKLIWRGLSAIDRTET